MREVQPRAMPDGSIRYPNPPAKAVFTLLPIGTILGGALLGGPLFIHRFGLVGFLWLGIPTLLVVAIVLLAISSRFLVMSVRIGSDYVVLHYVLWKRRIEPHAIKSITLEPPVTSDSLKWRYWNYPLSLLTVELVNSSTIRLILLPNGIKLRMARALDPEHFPIIES